MYIKRKKTHHAYKNYLWERALSEKDKPGSGLSGPENSCPLRTTPVFFLFFFSILFISVFNIPTSRGQDTQFSQFNASPLTLAPSFAGSTNGSRMVLNYRNQWPQIPGAFVAYSFSFDHYFHKYRSGVGMILYRDQAGSGNLALTRGGFNYAYSFKVNPQWTIRPGVQFSYEQRTINFFRLVFEDQIGPDGSIGPSNSAVNPIDEIRYFDAASSVLAYSNNIWAGLSLHNLMRPNQSMTSNSVSRIPVRTSLFAGYRIQYGGRFTDQESESISFAFMYKNQGLFNQLDLGAYWTKDPVFLGIIYRGIPVFNNRNNGFINNDAFVFMGGIRTENIRIGYSYDFTVSRLINNTGGAHEVSIIYEFNQSIPDRMRQQPPIWGN